MNRTSQAGNDAYSFHNSMHEIITLVHDIGCNYDPWFIITARSSQSSCSYAAYNKLCKSPGTFSHTHPLCKINYATPVIPIAILDKGMTWCRFIREIKVQKRLYLHHAKVKTEADGSKYKPYKAPKCNKVIRMTFLHTICIGGFGPSFSR